jgi:cohesin complex subunit SA-1/2
MLVFVSAEFLLLTCRLFMHRYRDVDPEIRMSCIRSLGIWVVSYPSLFLQDIYLKYLGWTLNDKVTDIKLICFLAY